MEGKKKIGLAFFLDSFIRETRLFNEGANILVGVSGGPDSMALLALLKELTPLWDLHLQVLHCHHGLRPEADEEAEFVRQWAKRWGCSFTLSHLPVKEFQKANKRSIQEAARELRYQAFLKAASKVGAEYIALGHNADDQAEEILIGLIRGASLGGLSGMPLRRGPFIRPLIRIYRAEILAYLASRKIPYCEDPSNRDFRYLRARVRYQLIPVLKQYSPNILVQLNRTGRLLEADESFLQEKTEEIAATLLRPVHRGIEIPRKDLARLPQALASRLLQKALMTLKGDLRQVGAVHLETLMKWSRGPEKERRLSLPGGWTAVMGRQALGLFPKKSIIEQTLPFVHEVHGPGSLVIPESGDELFFREKKGPLSFPFRNLHPNKAWVDGEKISWPLIVRNGRPGDRFTPWGRAGTKKVARFLMDRKIPKEERRRIPLVLSQGKIVWIAGVEIGEAFGVSPQTRTVLEMVYRKGALM